MSSGADAFPYPPDSPESITGVQKAYNKFATDLSTAKGKVSGDGGVIGSKGGWSGPGSQACGAEITGNTSLIGLAETAMGKVNGALKPYGTAIDTCRGEIDKLRTAYDQGLATHNTNMTKITNDKDMSPKIKQMAHYDEIGSWNTVADGLYTKYQGHLKDLNTAAKGVRKSLESIGSHIGKTNVDPKSTDLQLRLAMTAGLPMLDKQNAEADAKHVTSLIDKAAKGDKDALKELQQYGAESTNKYFATALMNDLGAKGLTEVPGYMAKHIADIISGDSDDNYEDTVKNNKWILNFLSNSLATATNFDSDTHVSQGWLDELKKQGRSRDHELDGGNTYNGYWGLGQILRAAGKEPPYSAKFMGDVGNDMIDWEREAEKNSPTHELPYEFGGPYMSGGPVIGTANLPGQMPDSDNPDTMGADPLIGLMHAAGTSEAGAQAIFTHGDNLNYLLHDRRDKWADKGNALGEAIEVGTNGHGATALNLTGQVVHILGQDTKGDTKVDNGTGQLSSSDSLNGNNLSGLRDSVGRMIGDHIEDVNLSINSPSDKSGVIGGHVNFDLHDLTMVMYDTSRDDTGYKAMVDAQVGFAKHDLDSAAAQPGSADSKLDALQSRAGYDGQTLGFILESRKQALNAHGKEIDAQNEVLAGYVEKGLGFVPVPKQAGPLGGLAKEKLTGWLVDQIKTDKYGEAVTQGASEGNSAQNLMQQMMQGAVVDHQIWDNNPHKPPSVIMAADGKHMVPLNQMNGDQQDAYRIWMSGRENPQAPGHPEYASQGSDKAPIIDQSQFGGSNDGEHRFNDYDK